MYKIKNISNGTILFNDLGGLKLSANQEIDLEEFCTREKIDNSLHLKIAENKKLVVVLHKDVYKTDISMAFLLEMEQKIKERILKEMSQGQSNNDISGLVSKIDDLITAVKNQPLATGGSVANEEYLETDEHSKEKLLKVHAKSMERISQNTSGFIEAKEKIEKSDISKKADELDDLLS